MVQISSDTLRYYDEIQLLNPDYINPSNNYRYYNEEQVRELLYIMELKDCGFNLEEVKRIIKLGMDNQPDGSKLAKLFEKKRLDLTGQRTKINASIAKIENKLKLLTKVTEGNVMTTKEKILIVDDAAFMRMMVKDILTKNGYEVVEAEDGNDGLAKFKEHRPALVIMDIVMPNMDGIDALKQIKKVDGGAKIIMLSAMSVPSHIADSLIAGAVDFVAKPFQADYLTAAVAKHLAEDVTIDSDEVARWCDENALLCKDGAKMSQDEINALLARAAKVACWYTETTPSHKGGEEMSSDETTPPRKGSEEMSPSEINELLARMTEA